MPDTFTAAYVTAKNTLHPTSPWAWLLDADIDGTNGFFCTSHDASLSYGGKLYVPFPIQVGVLPRDAEGNMPIVQITVANATREIGVRLEAGGIIDRALHLRLVNVSDLTSCQDWGEWTVTNVPTLSLQGAVLEVGPYDLFEAPLPARRQQRRCDYVDYGGLECGYDLTLPNLISVAHPLFDPTNCDLGFETSNGCKMHGLNEVANARPKKHPGRFGGEPGITKGPARV